MTTEQLEKIKWLNRAFYASKKMDALVAQKKQFEALAERITMNYNSDSKNNNVENSTENALHKLADIELSIKSEIKTLLSAYSEIDEAIQKIDDDILQSILKRRYLAFETIEQIAEGMDYERRTIQRKHKIALDKLSLNVIVCHPEM